MQSERLTATAGGGLGRYSRRAIPRSGSARLGLSQKGGLPGPAIEVVPRTTHAIGQFDSYGGRRLTGVTQQGNSEVGQRAARPIPERRPASPFASDKHLLGSRLPARANSLGQQLPGHRLSSFPCDVRHRARASS